MATRKHPVVVSEQAQGRTQYPDGWQPATQPPPRQRRHIFRWVFLAIQTLFLVWIITGAASSGGATAKSCAGLVGSALQTCHDASAVGTGIGVALIISLWVAVDVILGITWMIVRPRR